METNISWEKWKELLRTAMNTGEFMGLSEDRIKGAAYRFGGFFAGHIDAGNPEQRLLRDLWLEATEEERRALVSMMVKLLNRDDRREKLLDHANDKNKH
ncbi:MAG: DUF3243 domain-containing protein [Syntrophomonadaceae bacterium]|nr:DUF3243 domain-containing protein [Syntrophomonadaceae bacterium]